jgi:hypothetical protein
MLNHGAAGNQAQGFARQPGGRNPGWDNSNRTHALSFKFRAGSCKQNRMPSIVACRLGKMNKTYSPQGDAGEISDCGFRI